jgi:hypothetical protein
VQWPGATAKYLRRALSGAAGIGLVIGKRLEKGKGEKRETGLPAASVAAAVDLEGEEGGAPPAKRSNRSFLVEAVYAMGAIAGDPRANAHYMELHKEDVARRSTLFVSAQEYSCAMCAWIAFTKIMHNDLRSRHACSLPGAAVQLLSRSPHLHAQGELCPPACPKPLYTPSTPPFYSHLSHEQSLML